MKTFTLLVGMLLVVIPLHSGQWAAVTLTHADRTSMAEPDPIDEEVKKVQLLTRLSLGGLAVAGVSLLIIAAAGAGPAELLMFVIIIALLASFLLSFVNVLLARKVLRKLKAQPASDLQQKRIKPTKTNLILSLLPFLGLLGLTIGIFTKD